MELKLDQELTKQFVGELKGIDTSKRTITAMVSTDSVDRDGDIIVPSGWQLDNYRKNPVVLWAHDYSGLPVAKALAIEITSNGLLTMMQFAEHQLAQDVFELYAGGFLRAFSVGFRVLEYTRRVDEQAQSGWLMTKTELLEYSCVPVPANQDALVLAAKAAKLCGMGCGCKLSAPALAKTGEPHYLDLAEQTRSAESVPESDDPEAAQTRARLSASIAGLNDLTQRIEQGG